MTTRTIFIGDVHGCLRELDALLQKSRMQDERIRQLEAETGERWLTEQRAEQVRGIVRDVMFDYQMETRQEMMGLHLDLVKMGRSWKAELRSLMDEYVGDLSELREENKRLREENERLRRGY